jgi:hypothetical protein
MKRLLMLCVCVVPLAAKAQLPIPILPDWLRAGQAERGVLSQTHVTLTGNNYTIVQQNVTGRSRGFKLLGLFSFRGASYTEAMSRLAEKAQLQNGHPQAYANVIHESTSSNFILFSIPKVTIRADIIEFTPEYPEEEMEMSAPAPVLLKQRM